MAERRGTPGNDTLRGTPEDDLIIGFEGDDVLRGLGGKDQLEGGAGDDRIDSSGGPAESQGSGDVVYPGPGADTITGHPDAFVFLGYSDVSNSGGLTIDVGANGSGTAVSDAQGVVDDSFRRADSFRGTSQEDTFRGSDEDRFESWQGLAGDDTIAGGGGVDGVYYNADHNFGDISGVTVDLANGRATDGFGDTDTFTGIEIAGGSIRNDRLLGSAGRNNLYGNEGFDILDGRGGSDFFDGGADADIVRFDLSRAEAEAAIEDVVADEAGDVTVSASDEQNTFRDIEFLQFNDGRARASELLAIDREGTDGEDELLGGYTNDTLRGLAGDDTLDGGDGRDQLNGGTGADTIRGGATEADLRDTIYAGAGDDNVEGGFGNDLLIGMKGDDRLNGGFGVDELQGLDGNDTMNGAAFSDLVFGNAGDDFVNGGFGNDRINGGTGADKFFHIGDPGHGSDFIQDFSAREGDTLLFGRDADPGDFRLNTAETQGAGQAGVEEAFVTYAPSGQILWALIDGAAQDEIQLTINGETSFDLMA